MLHRCIDPHLKGSLIVRLLYFTLLSKFVDFRKEAGIELAFQFIYLGLFQQATQQNLNEINVACWIFKCKRELYPSLKET